MSTLRTNALEGVDAKNSITIVAGAGNITTTNVQDGLAVASFAFNIGSEYLDVANNTISTESFNASSGTDRGTGLYTVSLTSNMNTRQYIFTAGTKSTNNSNCIDGNSTTSSVLGETFDSDSSNAQDGIPYVNLHGSLA